MPRPYGEPLRPQFHFTSAKNWLNDPNGMVYHDGEYHLFFQHNPQGVEWGNMTWGHAVSKDMVQWQQLDHALLPDENGTIYSGTVIIDRKNAAGLNRGNEPAMLAFYTYATKNPGCQALAFSHDHGRTFTKFKNNPIVPAISPNTDRDPKVFFHEDSGRWVMVLYVDQDHTFAFFNSDDLINWEKMSSLEGYFECPDMFALPIDGDPENTCWVLHGADGVYQIGSFDGKTFRPENERRLKMDHGKNFFASQSFNHMPDNRTVQITWMRGGNFPGMPFNQQMGFPCELTLRSTHKGPRLFRWPIAEIDSLYSNVSTYEDLPLQEGFQNPLFAHVDDAYDIECTILPGTAREIGFGIHGRVFSYDVEREQFHHHTEAKVKFGPIDGKLCFRFLVDRASIETFGAEGLVSITESVLFSPNYRGLDLFVRGGEAKVESLQVRSLNSIWESTT